MWFYYASWAQILLNPFAHGQFLSFSNIKADLGFSTFINLFTFFLQFLNRTCASLGEECAHVPFSFLFYSFSYTKDRKRRIRWSPSLFSLQLHFLPLWFSSIFKGCASNLFWGFLVQEATSLHDWWSNPRRAVVSLGKVFRNDCNIAEDKSWPKESILNVP